MNRKLTLLIFLTLLLGIFTSAWADVTIGSGTGTNSNVPIISNYGYTYSQQIYTQAQIGSAASITRIRFYKAAGAITNSSAWIIYMAHTAKTTFATTTDWVPAASLTQVFSGSVTFPTVEGWYEIVLDTPFDYDYSSNLVIAVDENTPGYGALVSHRSFTSGAYTGIYYRSDTTNPSAAVPGTAYARTPNINQIQLVFPSVTPPNAAITPSPATLATDVAINPTLSWVDGGGGPTSYDVYFGTTANPDFVQNQAGSTFIPGHLDYSTEYFWQVIPKNENGEAADCPIWSFTTYADPTITSFPHVESFESATYPPVGWVHTLVSGATGITRVTSGTTSPTVSAAYDGTAMLHYNSNSLSALSNAWLATPPLNCSDPDSNHRVRFAMWRSSSSYPTSADRIEIYSNTVQDLSGTPILLGTVNRSKTMAPVETGADGWYQYAFDLGIGSRDIKYVIFKAVSAYGNSMNMDFVEIFQESAAMPPSAPISLNPANNATNVAINTNFSWVNGGGIPTAYKVYLGTDPESLESVTNQAESTFDPIDNLQFGKTYYWYVSAINDAGSADSATLSFSTATGLAITPAPANLATLQDATNRVLNWADVAGATSYKVIAGTTAGGTDLVNMESVSLSQYTHPENWPWSSSVYWTVYTLNGDQEVQGTEWSFSTGANPTLTAPVAEAFATFPPANWTRWTGLLAEPSILTSTTSGWIADGFANVGSSGAAKDNVYSTAHYNWMVTPPIDLSGKASYNLTFDLALTDFGSSALAEQTGTDDRFAVLISTDGTWNSANTLKLWDNAGSENVYNNIATAGERVSIDLSAYSGIIKIAFYGESTVSNADNDLFIDNFEIAAAGAPPTAPSTFTPANNATNVAINANLAWSGAAGTPTGYKVFMGTDASSMETIADQAASPYIQPANLLFNTTYYWAVQSYNDNGSSDGPTISFITTTGKAITPSPATATTNHNASLTTLDWADVAGATSYKISVGTSSGASDIANMVACATSSWIKPTDWLFEQTYYWTVYTLNGTQEVQGTEWTFTVGADPTVTSYPYSEGFNTATFPPSGWTNYSIIKSTGAVNNTGYWSRKTSGTYSSTAGAAFINYNYSATNWACLQLPQVNLPAKAKLSFYWRDNDSKIASNDSTFCEISANNGVTWTILATLSPAANQSTYQKVDAALDAYAGNGRLIRFRDGTNTSYTAWGTFVDELTIEEYVDYPAGTPVVVGTETITITGGSANNTTGEIPPVSNGIFVATESIVLNLLGAGPWTISIQTTAPWGAYYQNGSWNSVENSLGFITFVVNAAKDLATPIILGDADPTLPVTLSSFTATITTDLMVKIAWLAESETNHSGYNLMRAETPELSGAIKINPELISDGSVLGTQISYSYTDYEAYSNMQYYYWLESVALDGSSEFYGPLSITIGDPTQDPLPPVTPLATKLMNAYPNPFNPNTNIRYSLKEAGQVSIDIYNTKGQKVRSFQAVHNGPGYYQVAWDGRDASGNSVASGVYMYRMNSGKYTSSKKMILAK